MRLKLPRITRKTPFWLALLIILVGLAQQYGWFEQAKKTAIEVQPGYYSVTQFYDGDTIAVDMNGRSEKIRMIGVDTPETHDPRKPVQCFGQAASEFTRQLIGKSDVRLESDPQSNNRDRYDRLLRYVHLPDGRLVNAEIIIHGYGFAYTSFPFTKLDDFKRYEKEARDASRGLWSSCEPEIDDRGYIRSNPAEQ